MILPLARVRVCVCVFIQPSVEENPFRLLLPGCCCVAMHSVCQPGRVTGMRHAVVASMTRQKVLASTYCAFVCSDSPCTWCVCGATPAENFRNRVVVQQQ